MRFLVFAALVISTAVFGIEIGNDWTGSHYPRIAARCVGDCDEDSAVEINELVTGVRVLLGEAQLSACPAIDCSSLGPRINCMILAVDGALGACAPDPLAACGVGCEGPCYRPLPTDPPCPCIECAEMISRDGVTCTGSFCNRDECFAAYHKRFPELCDPPPKCGFGCDGVCNGFDPGVCPCTGECVKIFDCTPGSLCEDTPEQFDYCFGELTCRAPQ